MSGLCGSAVELHWLLEKHCHQGEEKSLDGLVRRKLETRLFAESPSVFLGRFLERLVQKSRQYVEDILVKGGEQAEE